ncbi:MAG: hypothetical protein ACK4YP_21335, partial [Myxococcota bacterium]
VRTAMTTGVSAGVGWERGFVADPPTWVAVLENYGPCKASGWVALRTDAPVDGLTVAGRPAAEVDAATVHAAAVDYLRVARPYDDPAAIAAWDLLRAAPTETLVVAVTSVAPGAFQERLWEALDQRDHEGAVALAERSTSTSLRAAVTAEVDALRAIALTDPQAPADAVYAALSVWRPGPADIATLDRLKAHRSARVRERAWELAIEQTAAACEARAADVDTADVKTVSAIHRECPQQPVRVATFNRLAKLDPVAAGAVLRVVLEEPETTRTGILAARHAHALERADLLEAVVRRPGVARDVRRVALELLVRSQNPAAPELVEQHGAYLGYRPPNALLPADTTADGSP